MDSDDDAMDKSGFKDDMTESCTVQYKNSRGRKREREARKGDDVFLIMITDIAADSK